MKPVDPQSRPRRSPYVAGVLSFLWPGLGQAYAGRRRAAALFALPALGILLAFLVQALTGIEQLAALVIDPSSALTILILILLVGLWRIVAIADAMVGRGVRRLPGRGRAGVAFAVLAALVLAVHVPASYYAWAFYDAGSRIFVGDRDPDGAPPSGAGSPGATVDPSDEYAATPFATPKTASSRINILLTGVDSAEQRTHALTDTLLVVSIDPETGGVAMVSVPRDISNFPLWDGRTFRGKINGLMTWARQHPTEFPDGPLPSLMKEIGYLLGVPIHYYAAIDLAGFRRMIDVAGGVDVNNPRAINDPRYDWLDGTHGFSLSAGRHHLNGRLALAYVRSRQGVGDSDYTRARRQQQVLVSLRGKLTDPSMVAKLDKVLDAAADTVKTNFPSARVGEMLHFATQMDDDAVKQYVLGPPYSTHPPMSQTGGVWTLKLDLDKVAKLSIELFGDDSRYATE